MYHPDFITGSGQRDTRKHSEGGTYDTATFQQLQDMAFQPPQMDKGDAYWAIFTTANGQFARDLAHQHEHGKVTALWLDFDEGDPTTDAIVAALREVVGDSYFMVYDTASNGGVREDGTVKSKKRAIIPVVVKITGFAYKSFARALNSAMRARGLTPDPITETITQLCYLPNRGPVYNPPFVNPGNLWDATAAPLASDAAELHAELQAEADERRTRQATFAKGGRKKEGRNSWLAAFRWKHPTHSYLELMGWTTQNGIDWHCPDQSTEGYPTELFPDGALYSLSGTVQAMGGRKSGLGHYFHDAFDLHCHAVGQAPAVAYAESLVNDPEYRAYQQGLSADNPYPIYQNKEYFDWWCAENVRLLLAREAAEVAEIVQEVKEAVAKDKEIEQQLAEAKENEWGGDWVNEVPFKIAPSPLEWAAWHAPGIIGQAVREAAPSANQKSLVPLLAGAMAFVSYISMDKFVGRWKTHITPPTMMLYLLGVSGGGKTDALTIFKKLTKIIPSENKNITGIKRDFPSAPSVFEYLSLVRPSVFILQDEAGSTRSSGEGDKHKEGMIGAVTNIFTAFKNGIEGTYIKSDKGQKDLPSVANPCISCMYLSTPGRMFSTISESDAESGWLGRNHFIKLPDVETNIEQVVETEFSENLRGKVMQLSGVLPPNDVIDVGVNLPVWKGDDRSYHIIDHSAETASHLVQTAVRYDQHRRKVGTIERERAVYNRAAEGINRASLIGALAESTSRPIQMHVVRWAEVFQQESMDYLLDCMNRRDESEDTSTPSSRIRRAIKTVFETAATDKQYRNKLNGARLEAGSGDVLIKWSKLKIKVKSLSHQNAALVSQEMADMIDVENGTAQLEVIPEISNAKTKWLRYLGA